MRHIMKTQKNGINGQGGEKVNEQVKKGKRCEEGLCARKEENCKNEENENAV